MTSVSKPINHPSDVSVVYNEMLKTNTHFLYRRIYYLLIYYFIYFLSLEIRCVWFYMIFEYIIYASEEESEQFLSRRVVLKFH